FLRPGHRRRRREKAEVDRILCGNLTLDVVGYLALQAPIKAHHLVLHPHARITHQPIIASDREKPPNATSAHPIQPFCRTNHKPPPTSSPPKTARAIRPRPSMFR